jgi:hypothetical protein
VRKNEWNPSGRSICCADLALVAIFATTLSHEAIYNDDSMKIGIAPHRDQRY